MLYNCRHRIALCPTTRDNAGSCKASEGIRVPVRRLLAKQERYHASASKVFNRDVGAGDNLHCAISILYVEDATRRPGMGYLSPLRSTLRQLSRADRVSS